MIRVEDVRGFPLFEGVTDEQLEELIAAGEEVSIVPGEELFHEGDLAASWWVLVEGSVDLTRHSGREETLVGRMDAPGRWAGGFLAWDEHGTYLATGRGAEPGRMLRVPAEALRSQVQAWFPLAVHLISGLFNTARSIESTARHRDSLVTLGTLAAGLAHELNNPVAAAGRAVNSLDATSGALLDALADLAVNELTASQYTALDALRRSVTPAAAPSDPLEMADREDEAAAWLQRHDVPDPWRLAGELTSAGIELESCERAAELVSPGTLAPALAWLTSAITAQRLLGEVREATGRISELVSAVRSYTQMDRATLQPVDVREGLESTITMLGHKLRQGSVTVVLEFEEGLPRVDGYAGELNQVWTNLIDNAIDAMPDGGTLTVVAGALDGVVQVEIRDTGHGMPPEVAARAYDTFFTTKEVGRGTGLGLDIARRVVVDRHHGEIDIDSSEAGTTLRVRLPLG